MTMKATEGIIEKILSDARERAKEITDKAEFDKAMCEKATEQWVGEYFNAQRNALKKEAEEVVERKLTLSKLDSRKITLKVKQEIIGDIFSRALKKLQTLKKGEYLAFILKLLEKYAEDGDQIVLSRDKVLCQKDFLDEKIIKEKNLTFANAEGEFIGGIALIGKVCDKDLSFKAILEESKENIIDRISAELFN